MTTKENQFAPPWRRTDWLFFLIQEYHYCSQIKEREREKRETIALKEQMQLYSSLYVGCRSRQANLDEFFCHENHEYLPSLFDYGSIRKPTSKTDFLKCLLQFPDDSNKKTFEKYEDPSVNWCSIDGAALEQMDNPRTSNTFGQYYRIEISKKGWENRWYGGESGHTFIDKHQENKKHVKEGERRKG